MQEKNSAGTKITKALGFHEFEDALRQFVSQDRSAVWLQSVFGSLRRILSQLRLILDLEMTALATPVERIKENREAFETKKIQVVRQKVDYEVLLNADLNRLLTHDVQGSLERFKQSQKERLPRLITEWAEDSGTLSSRQLTTALESRLLAEIRTAYDGWIQAQEAEIAKSFRALCERFSSSIYNTIDELSSYSASLFSVPFDPAAGESTWVTEFNFSYKFWYEPVGLQILTSTFVLALPRKIGHRLIVRRMLKRAADLVEMQTGRIRHAWEQRLNKSCAAFRRQLVGQIDAMIEGVERAIEHGLAMRRRGEVDGRRRKLESGREIKEIDGLETRAKAAIDHKRT